MATADDVRRIALKLPGAYEQPSHGGAPSYRTKPRAFAFIREEWDAVVLYVASEEDKHALVASAPDIFFTTAHYDGYALVLVRLSAVDTQELTELVTEAWRLRAPKTHVQGFDATARGPLGDDEEP